MALNEEIGTNTKSKVFSLFQDPPPVKPPPFTDRVGNRNDSFGIMAGNIYYEMKEPPANFLNGKKGINYVKTIFQFFRDNYLKIPGSDAIEYLDVSKHIEEKLIEYLSKYRPTKYLAIFFPPENDNGFNSFIEDAQKFFGLFKGGRFHEFAGISLDRFQVFTDIFVKFFSGEITYFDDSLQEKFTTTIARIVNCGDTRSVCSLEKPIIANTIYEQGGTILPEITDAVHRYQQKLSKPDQIALLDIPLFFAITCNLNLVHNHAGLLFLIYDKELYGNGSGGYKCYTIGLNVSNKKILLRSPDPIFTKFFDGLYNFKGMKNINPILAGILTPKILRNIHARQGDDFFWKESSDRGRGALATFSSQDNFHFTYNKSSQTALESLKTKRIKKLIII